MNEHETSRPETALAATLYLLSSSVARGMTAAKTQALVLQLCRLAEDPSIDPTLRNACAELHEHWAAAAQRLGCACGHCVSPQALH